MPAPSSFRSSTIESALDEVRCELPAALTAVGASSIPDGRETRRPLRVMLVCSSGGHLAQLHNLSLWWSKHERTWVTFKGADSLSILEGERVQWAYQPTTRNIRNALRNLFLSFRLVRRIRPDLIVSTGAGVAFPFFIMGKLWGAQTVYVEVYDRINSSTLTGRLCYPLTDLFVLQWEAQKRMYPKGQVVGALV